MLARKQDFFLPYESEVASAYKKVDFEKEVAPRPVSQKSSTFYLSLFPPKSERVVLVKTIQEAGVVQIEKKEQNTLRPLPRGRQDC